MAVQDCHQVACIFGLNFPLCGIDIMLGYLDVLAQLCKPVDDRINLFNGGQIGREMALDTDTVNTPPRSSMN
jgi:hypothetical protein